jgi:hypothetical protein
MDSKKNLSSAARTFAKTEQLKHHRQALCGRYLTFAQHDVVRGRRLFDLLAPPHGVLEMRWPVKRQRTVAAVSA